MKNKMTRFFEMTDWLTWVVLSD